jgi:hypothetical protein
MFNVQTTGLFATIAVASLGSVSAGAIPLASRSLLPTWACPGPNEGQANFDIKTDDMQALATAIQQNSLTSGHMDDSILIKADHGYLIKAGTVQVCIENQYLFENAHFARTDMALAVAQGMYNCCGGKDNLQATCNVKPWTTMYGDTGLKAWVTIGQAGDECKGAPDTSDYLSDGEFAYKTGKFFWDVFGPLITGAP